jgi:hypothetical protein
MNSARFTNNRHEFRLLDFVAMFAWKTDTSISFMLGKYGDTLTFADRPEPWHVGKNAVFNVFGWLDVQHPCHDHIKARVRAKLSPEYMTLELQREMLNCVFDHLEIPRDETYEADFFVPSDQSAIHQRVDRDGLTDRT